MSTLSRQAYLDRLAFVLDRRRVFDPTGYTANPNNWTRQQKANLSRAYNEALLANSTGDMRDYAEMARRLRPFTRGFDSRNGYNIRNVKNWTPQQKAKLTRYFKKAVDLAAKPFTLYKSSNKQQMSRMAEIANQKGYPAFHSIFYPSPPGSKITFNKKRNAPRVRGRGVTSTRYYWEDFGYSLDDVARDPEGVINDIVSQLEEKQFAVIAGEYVFGGSVPRIMPAGPLVRAVNFLMERYGADRQDADDYSSSYYGNWMHGIEGFLFSDRPKFREYMLQSQAESRARRRNKRALRAKLRRDQKVKRYVFRLALFMPKYRKPEFDTSKMDEWSKRKKSDITKAYNQLVSDVGLKNILLREKKRK